LDKNVFIVAAFAIIGIAMIIGGIFNLRETAPEPEEEPAKKGSKKKRTANAEAPKSGSNLIANWFLGGNRGMDLKKQGRMRIQIGTVLTVIALLLAYVYLIR